MVFVFAALETFGGVKGHSGYACREERVTHVYVMRMAGCGCLASKVMIDHIPEASLLPFRPLYYLSIRFLLLVFAVVDTAVCDRSD